MLLEMLHLRDHLHVPAVKIARKFGMTKGKVAGQFFRLDQETRKHDRSPHLNGTLPPLWWRG